MSKYENGPRLKQMLCIHTVGAGILTSGRVYDVVDENSETVKVILPNGTEIRVSRRNFEEN